MSSLTITACTADHIGDRHEQQDRVALLTSPRHPKALLAVVADGMSGRSGGRMAADQVISTVSHVFSDLAEEDAGGLHGLLRAMADEAHTMIRLSALSSEQEPHATFVALILRGRYATWAHAGDSRLYHFRAGRLLHRTVDQTFSAYLRAEGRAKAAEQADEKFRHIVVSALGLRRPPDVVIGEASHLSVGDTFLLCSDGLWSYFSDDELGRTLDSLAPREASDWLVSLARKRARGRGDNLSLAIVKVDPPAPKPRRTAS